MLQKQKDYYLKKKPSDALRYLDRASALTSSKTINILKAEALLGLKEYDRATAMVTPILQRDDTNSDALHVRGFGLYRLGNHSQALVFMKRIIAYNPDDAKAIKLLKMIRGIERAKEQAYTTAVQIDPENDKFNATLCCNKAAALMKQGNYKEAIIACTEAIERDEEYVKAYKRRAACHTQENNHEEAVRDLQQVKQMDPEDREIASELRQAKKRLKIA